MARIVADRVLETSTTVGTGSYTLDGAILGYRPASSVCVNGDEFTYYAEDVDTAGRPLGSWETGLGTWTTGNILVRTTVFASSNAGSVVSWSAGTRNIALSVLANASLGPTTIVGDIVADNLSGTNTGDQDLSGKQDVLVSGTNIKTVGGLSILGSGDLTVSGGFAYVKKTANYTAVHNDYIYADVSGGSFIITLPATPSANDVVYIADYAGLFGTANVTVARNGSTIEGATTDATLSFPNKEYTFVYIDTSWQIFTKDAQVGVTSQVYLTGPTTGNEGTDIILEIAGWSALAAYTPSVSGGTAVQTTSSLRWTLPSVTSDTAHTLTLSVTGGGSYIHTVNVINVSTLVDTSISVTDFSIKDSSVGWSI